MGGWRRANVAISAGAICFRLSRGRHPTRGQPLRVKAAVCHELNRPLAVEELELVRGPLQNEVLVRWEASGVCHSDLAAINDYFGFPVPFVTGHEGGGIVEEVGPGVTRV